MEVVEEEKKKISEELFDPEKEFETMWKHETWLNTYPLHAGTFYDYFKNSDFYDRQCNNGILEQQQTDMRMLKEMKGIEYGLDTETLGIHNINAPMYLVINKYERNGPNDEKDRYLRNIYYSPGHQQHPNRGAIYPMPTMNLIFDNKLRNATFHLNNALNSLNNCKKHQLSNGFIWDFEKNNNNNQNNNQNNNDNDIEMKNNNQNENEKEKENLKKKKEQNKPKIIKFNQYSSIVDNLIFDLAKTQHQTQ